MHWVLCLKGFYLSLMVGILGEVSGEDFNRIIISLPDVPIQGVVSTDWSALG